MKTGAFNKKIIYNHLLAVALAGIVSLLFLQRICQFLNTSSKRLDYAATTSLGCSGNQESLESCYLETDCHSGSCSEDFILIQGVLSFRVQSHRFGKLFPISTLDQHINFEKSNHPRTFYRYGLPPMWGPSIPIAHRRLII